MNMCWLYDFMKWPESVPFYRLGETQHFLFGWDEKTGFEEIYPPIHKNNLPWYKYDDLKIPCYPVESKNES
jgi:hypothetical protein